MINLDFIKAGKAIFTVTNNVGKHYTFKITKKENEEQIQRNLSLGTPAGNAGQISYKKSVVYFASVLKGPDNYYNYSYVGIYNPSKNEVFPTKKSNYQKPSIEYKILSWALSVIEGKAKLPNDYSINHAGKCGKCGRRLTTPDSIKFGIGPECIKHLHGNDLKKVNKIKKLDAINDIFKEEKKVEEKPTLRSELEKLMEEDEQKDDEMMDFEKGFEIN
jgi:hypothetical protein